MLWMQMSTRVLLQLPALSHREVCRQQDRV